MSKKDSNDFQGTAQLQLREALELTRPEMVALSESELLPINLDPLAAVSMVRGALPMLFSLCGALAQEIRSFDPSRLRQLERYACALTQAQTVYQGVTIRSKELTKLSAQAAELRARLLVDAKALVQRGHISESRLAKLDGPNGHRNIASDLLTLATVLRDSWPDIVNRTAIREEELDHAEQLGDQLVTAIGRRKQTTEIYAKAAVDRRRAYTLFVRAYDEVRRAVSFLRWHEGDAAQIAPSLYIKKKVVRKKSTDEPAAAANEDAPEAPIAPVAQPNSDPFLN